MTFLKFSLVLHFFAHVSLFARVRTRVRICSKTYYKDEKVIEGSEFNMLIVSGPCRSVAIMFYLRQSESLLYIMFLTKESSEGNLALVRTLLTRCYTDPVYVKAYRYL